jgi:hypothetical protein
MKKATIFLGLALFVTPLFSADLLTGYKKGIIKLVPDPAFGTATAWDMLFKAELDRKIAFLPDGGFLKPAYRDGKIIRFNANGAKIAEIGGRVGQGPGDLGGPKLLDILDGNTLVIYEETNRRLSLFGLDGRFLRIAKIESPGISASEPVVALTALKDGKIAVVSKDQTSTFWTKRFRVLIKDLAAGAETEIASFADEKPQSPIFIKNESFDGAVYLARAGGDRLVVAYSKSPEIAFYSFDGKKASSFNIESERIPIAFEHLEFAMKPDPKDAKAVEGFQKVKVANRDKIRLPEFHPFYLGLGTDPDGRIILVSNNLAKMTKDISWGVYSSEGKPLATVKIDPGKLELVHPYEVFVRGDSLFAWLARPDADGTQFLAKVRIAD